MSASPPRDSLDLRAARDGARREIPWDLPIDPALDVRQRESLGRMWLGLARQEHLAVGAFAILQSELAAVGCESVVLALVARAAADEVRHADLCRRLAARFLDAARAPRGFTGVPSIPQHPGAAPRVRALLHVVEMCCVNETFTGVYFTELVARARDPVTRAAVESLLEDEIDHGRVGWAHLASACRAGWGQAALAPSLPSLLERAVAGVMEPALASRAPSDPLLEAHACWAGAATGEVYRRALADVVLAGFDSLGVDTAAARERMHARGWLPG